MKQYKNTVQTTQNTINTSTHITKTPTQLSLHPHITKPIHTHTHTLQPPPPHTHTHITNPTHTHTHIIQNKLKQSLYRIHTKWNSHNTIKYPQYEVPLMCLVFCPQEIVLHYSFHACKPTCKHTSQGDRLQTCNWDQWHYFQILNEFPEVRRKFVPRFDQ